MLLLYSVKDVIIKTNDYDKFSAFTYFNIRIYMPRIKEYGEKESKGHLEGFIVKALFILEKYKGFLSSSKLIIKKLD